MNPLYPEVAERAAHRCEYCRAPKAMFNFLFEVEHIRPRSAGGTDNSDNTALSCRACNIFKGTRQAGRDPETQQMVSLFNPRHDEWQTHFEIDPLTNEIHGKTPLGRATVVQLQMNSEDQLQARALWRALNYFP